MIERLRPPVGDSDVRDLAQLLADAVESGAAVSFVKPLSLEEAEAWWRKVIAGADPRAIFLVARDAGRIVGTVQLHPAWAPNQPHRAEVVKLLVHRDRRRSGLGTRLMHAIEESAREAGFGLLTLDAKRGENAEHLYRAIGWTHAGTIPRFAVDPDGVTPHDAVIFYKLLQNVHDAAVKPVPQGASVVIPRLVCRDPAAAIDFYTSALGAVELGRRPGPDGSVAHAMLTFGPAMVMIEAEWPTLPLRAPSADGSSPVVLYLYVENADDTVARATAAGARVLVPLQDQFWGDRIAWLMDPFGHVWTVASRIEDTTASEREQRWSKISSALPKGEEPRD